MTETMRERERERERERKREREREKGGEVGVNSFALLFLVREHRLLCVILCE